MSQISWSRTVGVRAHAPSAWLLRLIARSGSTLGDANGRHLLSDTVGWHLYLTQRHLDKNTAKKCPDQEFMKTSVVFVHRRRVFDSDVVFKHSHRRQVHLV